MLVPRAGDACPRCGIPAEDSDQGCLGCLADEPPQRATIVWGEHDGVLRTVILALKHGGRDDLAALVGSRLAARIAAEPWGEEIDAVVPVPSHPWRRLRRPWPATELLASEVAARLGVALVTCLRRHGMARQTGRSRARRLDLPQAAFSAAPTASGRTLLLIDDVTTTGTTLRRAAQALVRAGAETVYCCVAAHTPDPRRYP